MVTALDAASSSGAGPARRYEELFRIERSTNRNVVCYDARLARNGALDPTDPIAAYWVLLAEDGRRESLTWLERQLAYGFSTAAEGAGVRLVLKAFERRAVHVRPAGTGYRAELPILGKIAALRRIWVQADSGLFGPQVRYIELRGTDVQSGQPLVERIER